MCARYFVRMEEHENASIAEEVDRRYKNTIDTEQVGGVVAPSGLAPVRCRDRHGRPGYFLMHFGFKLNRTMVINARSESVTEKPLFRPLARERRCLIPANHYTEWQHAGKQSIPYQFESSAFPLMFFAGLYRLEPGAKFADFVILTRNAVEPFLSIHDRMPLILNPEEQSAWLNPTSNIEPILLSGITDLSFAKVQA